MKIILDTGTKKIKRKLCRKDRYMEKNRLEAKELDVLTDAIVQRGYLSFASEKAKQEYVQFVSEEIKNKMDHRIIRGKKRKIRLLRSIGAI